MALPADIRLRVHHFAVIEPHPLTLTSYPFNWMAHGYSVEKDSRLLETCGEFRREMSGLLYSQNSFTCPIPRHEAEEEDSKMSKIDLRRVQKCYIPINDMVKLREGSDTGEGVNSVVQDKRFHEDFAFFVNTPAFASHEMKSVLIECEPREHVYLAGSLSPLFLLGNIGSVHFRSPQTGMHRFFLASWRSS